MLHKYGHDYKVIFVGDAAMSPYEITPSGRLGRAFQPGSGRRLAAARRQHLSGDRLAQPHPERQWEYSASTRLIQQLVSGSMYPLTLDGLDDAMRELTRKKH